MNEPDLNGLLEAARVSAPVLAPALVNWQASQGRHHLPWQGTRDPYRVWLSEIMLQQTQVSTVLGYYDRFLRQFPDVAALAEAPLDEVLTLWAGLGYYSRARNLHRCAQAVVSDHGGRFPASAALLEKLPGVGRTTAAAIAAFCFDQRVSILDGNVKRVLGRALAWPGDLAVARHELALWQAAQVLLPLAETDMPAYTQGLMDLGATVCVQRQPKCLLCPWQAHCLARRAGEPEAYPVKSRKLKRSKRESWCLWLESEGAVWLVQRPPTGIWAGLWTVPLFDTEASLLEQTRHWPGPLETQPGIKHVLTHLDWMLHPRRLVLVERPRQMPPGCGDGRWVQLSDLQAWALPAPMSRLLAP